jgi:hypothetical protein
MMAAEVDRQRAVNESVLCVPGEAPYLVLLAGIGYVYGATGATAVDADIYRVAVVLYPGAKLGRVTLARILVNQLTLYTCNSLIAEGV